MVPIITLFAVAVLEFGIAFWERQQLQAGVRDAARYWSRCNTLSATAGSCSVPKATAIASRNGVLPVTLTVTPTEPPDPPTSADIVTVTGSFTHSKSPMFVLLKLKPFVITYTYKMRFIGW